MEINQKIGINASPEKIWDVLTQNKYVKQYMFNCKIDSAWTVGADLIYYMEMDGKRMNMVSGKIEQLEKPVVLRHTLFPVGADFPDIPENHIYIIYSIHKHSKICELEVFQAGFDTAAMGEKRYEDSKGSFDLILPEIKRLAETA